MTKGAFRLRRIGVCGSSGHLPRSAVTFCEALGARLGESSVVIVSGGARTRALIGDDDLAADWHIVNAAAKVIPRPQLNDRIETISLGGGGRKYFQLGKQELPRGKTGEARRFSFVRRVDALVAVAGRSGTAQELSLAAELDMPVLPVPTFGGAARAFWDAYRSELMEHLGLTEENAASWEAKAPKDGPTLVSLATDMLRHLLDRLPRRCFVIMPYEEAFSTLYDSVIEPAIEAAGDESIRLDRRGAPGNVRVQIHEGIKTCDYAIVILDGLRPNVIYELGLAQGRDKPTILLHRLDRRAGEPLVPFDLAMEQRLDYETADATLCDRLRRAIEVIPARRW